MAGGGVTPVAPPPRHVIPALTWALIPGSAAVGMWPGGGKRRRLNLKPGRARGQAAAGSPPQLLPSPDPKKPRGEAGAQPPSRGRAASKLSRKNRQRRREVSGSAQRAPSPGSPPALPGSPSPGSPSPGSPSPGSPSPGSPSPGSPPALPGSPPPPPGSPSPVSPQLAPGQGGLSGGLGAAGPAGLPYYLCNFLAVLDTVLGTEDRHLFSEEDNTWITSFLQLSVDAKKLYVRLFLRKLNWLKVNKLDYAEIGLDLTPYIRELGEAGLFQTESDLQDVSESLNLLSGPEIKVLAKRFLVPGSGRGELVMSLLRLSRQRSLFGGLTGSTTSSVMVKRAKELAGSCVRVARAPRAVLSRLLLLFSLTDAVEEEQSSGHNQMSTVLLVNMGRTIFPQYKVTRNTAIFRHRDDLIRYEAAAHALRDVRALMESGHWDDALELYRNIKDQQSQAATSSDIRFDRELPVYLRCFTAGWVSVRLRSCGVEILQRLRLYQEAVKELRALLAQTVYCVASRGQWWKRLALNLEQHLKQTEQAVHCILEGLDDGHIRPSHRLALHQRATRIRDSPSSRKWQPLLLTLPASGIGDVPHVTVKGKLCPQTGMGNSFFLLETAENFGSLEKGSGEATLICSVEQLALAHYRQQGFNQGIHGEGTTWTTLFGLLFWDTVFMDGIPDVFRNSYQAFPLDLYTDCFYTNRREAMDSRLELVRKASPLALQGLIADVWQSQEGKVTPLVTWQLFSSMQQAQSLVGCLGGEFVSGVCNHLVKNLRHYRAGLPDLLVWNSNSFKLVEVKGPNDRLSAKQTVWLHELRQLGAEVEVCHVTAVGARSTRLS